MKPDSNRCGRIRAERTSVRRQLEASFELASRCRRARLWLRRTPRSRRRTRSKAPVSFVNKAWKLTRVPGVAAGPLYVFLSEGTLVITSPHSRPALGKWTYDQKVLTMVEEGIAYKVDILTLTADGSKS